MPYIDNTRLAWRLPACTDLTSDMNCHLQIYLDKNYTGNLVEYCEFHRKFKMSSWDKIHITSD